MFGSRRLAKRSIIGTRVCAPWKDSRFYPGVISATQTWPNGEEVFTIHFDDGFIKTVQDKDLFGPGFQTIQAAKLKKGQKVYITHNGREVSGKVDHHDTLEDNVFLILDSASGGAEVDRKLEEVRLLPSRKSSRLQKLETDYSKMADMPSSESKKRTVSQIIDVPSPSVKQSRRRKLRLSPDEEMECDEEQEEDDEEEMVNMEEEEEEEEDGTASTKTESPTVMDEHMAAMVLTSLSCSPVSPSFPPAMKEKGGSPSPASGSSFASSGIWGMKGDSPPQLSSSAPITASTLFGTPPVDEGIELDDTAAYFEEDSAPRKRRASTRTVFRCTWPSCGKLYNTVNGIERHVRCEHLGPKSYDGNDSDSASDHEEEFYYTEVEVTVDMMTQTFADMYTSSPPPQSSFPPPPPDHDYQKKSIPLSIPQPRVPPPSQPMIVAGPLSPSSSVTGAVGAGAVGTPHGGSYPGTLSINIPQLSRSLSWQANPTSKLSKTSPSPKPFSHSPKNSPMHKKSRSETKKCRKIYGMENREMWCTQCKWKKACTRFMD